MKLRFLAITLLLAGCTKPPYEMMYEAKPAYYSYIMGDIKGDHISQEYHADVYATPASCQKSITALLAYKKLGEAYRYETKLFSTKNQDVVVSFSGDPTLRFDDILDLLKPLKGQKIKGKIILDASLFQVPPHSKNLIGDDIGTPYGQPVSAMIIDRNIMTIIGEDGKLEDVSPKEIEPYILSKMQSAMALLKIKGDVEIVHEKVDDGKTINTHYSLPLKELIPPAFKISYNLTFDSLYLTIAHAQLGAPIKQWDDGDQVYKTLLKDYFDIDTPDAKFMDGSGLSRYDRIQPKTLYTLLKKGYEMDVFVNSFATPGEKKTTLEERLSLNSDIRAKTGSMTGIGCLCGYNIAQDTVFVVMASGFAPPLKNLRPVIDHFVSGN